MFRNPLSKQGTTTRTRKSRGRRKPPVRPRTFLPRLEALESLTLPSTVTWVGGSGDWDTPANWSDGTANRVPTAGDDAVISTTGLTITHANATVDAVNSLTSQSAVILSGGSLTLGGSTSQISAAFTVGSGGTLTLSGTTLNGSGTLTTAGTLNVLAATVNAALVNQGSALAAGTSALNGSFANAGGASLWVQGNGTYGHATLTAANGFTNDGTLRLESINGGYNETLVIAGGALTNAADGTLLVNAGAGGNRTFTGNLTNQGTVTVAAGISLQVNGTTPAFTQAGGGVSAAGLFYVAGGSFTFSGGSLSGAVYADNSQVSVTAGVTAASTLFASGNSGLTLLNNLSPAVTVWVQGNGTFGHANVSVAAGAANAGTLHLESANGGYDSVVTIPSGSFTNSGVISVSSGSGGNRSITGNLINQGQVAVDADTSLTIQGGTYTAAGGTISGPGYVLNDTLQETTSPAGASTIVLAGSTTLTSDNLAGYTLWVQGGNFGGHGALAAAGGFTNYGTLRLETINGGYNETVTAGSGTLTNAAGGTILTNAGTGGNRTLTGAVTNQGTITAAAGATLQNNGTGAFNQTGGSLTAAGQFYRNGGSFNFNGGMVGGNVVVDAGQLSVTPTITMTSTIITAGSSTLVGDVPAALTVWVQASSQFGGSATLTAASSFTNYGTLRLEAINSSYAVTLNVTSGTLTNAAGASILVNPGTGGNRTLGLQLNNQGTVTVAQFASLNKASAAHVNGGVITVTSGGNLTVNQSGTSPSFVNNGTLSAAGGNVTISQTGTAPTFTNNGTLSVAAGLNLNIQNGTLTNLTGTTLVGGTYTIGGTL